MSATLMPGDRITVGKIVYIVKRKFMRLALQNIGVAELVKLKYLVAAQ